MKWLFILLCLVSCNKKEPSHKTEVKERYPEVDTCYTYESKSETRIYVKVLRVYIDRTTFLGAFIYNNQYEESIHTQDDINFNNPEIIKFDCEAFNDMKRLLPING